MEAVERALAALRLPDAGDPPDRLVEPVDRRGEVPEVGLVVATQGVGGGELRAGERRRRDGTLLLTAEELGHVRGEASRPREGLVAVDQVARVRAEGGGRLGEQLEGRRALLLLGLVVDLLDRLLLRGDLVPQLLELVDVAAEELLLALQEGDEGAAGLDLEPLVLRRLGEGDVQLEALLPRLAPLVAAGALLDAQLVLGLVEILPGLLEFLAGRLAVAHELLDDGHLPAPEVHPALGLLDVVLERLGLPGALGPVVDPLEGLVADLLAPLAPVLGEVALDLEEVLLGRSDGVAPGVGVPDGSPDRRDLLGVEGTQPELLADVVLEGLGLASDGELVRGLLLGSAEGVLHPLVRLGVGLLLVGRHALAEGTDLAALGGDLVEDRLLFRRPLDHLVELLVEGSQGGLLRLDLSAGRAEGLGTGLDDGLREEGLFQRLGGEGHLDVLEGRAELATEERRELRRELLERRGDLGIVLLNGVVDRVIEGLHQALAHGRACLPGQRGGALDLAGEVEELRDHLGGGEVDVLRDELELRGEGVRDLRARDGLCGLPLQLAGPVGSDPRREPHPDVDVPQDVVEEADVRLAAATPEDLVLEVGRGALRLLQRSELLLKVSDGDDETGVDLRGLELGADPLDLLGDRPNVATCVKDLELEVVELGEPCLKLLDPIVRRTGRGEDLLEALTQILAREDLPQPRPVALHVPDELVGVLLDLVEDAAEVPRREVVQDPDEVGQRRDRLRDRASGELAELRAERLDVRAECPEGTAEALRACARELRGRARGGHRDLGALQSAPPLVSTDREGADRVLTGDRLGDHVAQGRGEILRRLAELHEDVGPQATLGVAEVESEALDQVGGNLRRRDQARERGAQ